MESKRRDRVRVQRELVKFIALLFSFSSELKIWSFHVVVVQEGKKCTKMRDARAELLFCS